MDLIGKKILIFGLGISGMGALRFLSTKEVSLMAVNEGVPSSWSDYNEVSQICSLSGCFDQDATETGKAIEKADLIILSPGIPREHRLLKNTTTPIWSEIELAFHFCQAPIIAITGTNGKTTTVSFLDHLLKSIGKKIFTGGNIGVAFCDHIRSGQTVDYILLELSSFQLESTDKFKPIVSALLNIFPNHGERYKDVNDYAKAKFNITKAMDKDGTLIFDSSDEFVNIWGLSFVGKKVAIDTGNSEKIEEDLKKLFNLTDYKLPGIHNKINLKFCVEILNSLGLLEENIEKLQMGITSFAGVPHRIEYVESNENFEIYNDAKSTNWDATMTAVNSMGELNKDLVLIMGGKLRGNNDAPDSKVHELFKNKLKKVFLIGESAELLKEELGTSLPCFIKGTLKAATDELKDENFKGIVLFSPGFPSFDQFKNYVQRGDEFKSLFKKSGTD